MPKKSTDDSDTVDFKRKMNDSNSEKEQEDLLPVVKKSSFVKKRFGKNPTVDTSFLPDKDRQAEEDMLR